MGTVLMIFTLIANFLTTHPLLLKIFPFRASGMAQVVRAHLASVRP
jgi:hypothetical protein